MYSFRPSHRAGSTGVPRKNEKSSHTPDSLGRLSSDEDTSDEEEYDFDYRFSKRVGIQSALTQVDRADGQGAWQSPELWPSGPHKYRCPWCGGRRSYQLQQELKSHLSKKHGRYYREERSFEGAEESNTGSTYTLACGFCNTGTFNSSVSLRNHIAAQHYLKDTEALGDWDFSRVMRNHLMHPMLQQHFLEWQSKSCCVHLQPDDQMKITWLRNKETLAILKKLQRADYSAIKAPYATALVLEACKSNAEVGAYRTTQKNASEDTLGLRSADRTLSQGFHPSPMTGTGDPTQSATDTDGPLQQPHEVVVNSEEVAEEPILGSAPRQLPDEDIVDRSIAKVESESSDEADGKASSQSTGHTSTMESYGDFEEEREGYGSLSRADERILHPRLYFERIKSLKLSIFEKSAFWKLDALASIPKEPPKAQPHSWQEQLRIPPLDPDVFGLFTSWGGAQSFILDTELRSFLEAGIVLTNARHGILYLQREGFCNDRISLLVIDETNHQVAVLKSVQIRDINRVADGFITALEAMKNGFRMELPPVFDSVVEALTADCAEFLLSISSYLCVSFDRGYLLHMTAHILDLALLSYVHAHTDPIGEGHTKGPVAAITVPNPDLEMLDIDNQNLNLIGKCPDVSLMLRNLRCFGEFFGNNAVWALHTHPCSTGSDDRLYLSADVETLADIWGPLWGTKDQSSGNIIRYSIENGFIVPWDADAAESEVVSSLTKSGQVLCHWISSRDWDDEFVKAHQSVVERDYFQEQDKLLIGANARDLLVVNSECTMTADRKLEIKSSLKNKNNLRCRGTRLPRRAKDSQTFQVQVSAAGFASLGTAIQYKRTAGFNRKDALIERWRHGARSIQFLEIWGGVEVSLCSGNARRRQLRHLLAAEGMRQYLKTISFRWDDPDCEEGYFRSLESCLTFRKFWNDHVKWRKCVGDAIEACFNALEETGVDPIDHNLCILWVDNFEAKGHQEHNNPRKGEENEFVSSEENLVVFRRSQHSWTGLLSESPECMTMALIDDKCLDYNDSEEFGMRCQALRFNRDGRRASRYSPGYPVLQTSLYINDSLLTSEGLHYRNSVTKRKHSDANLENIDRDRRLPVGPSKPLQNAVDPSHILKDIFGSLSSCWAGHWDATKIRTNSRFSLGIQGYLKVLRPPLLHYPVLMEWEPVHFASGNEVKTEFNETLLGRNGEWHHYEYTEGIYQRAPLPCIVMSKERADRL